jgi:alcohol dehydrogenase class IV
MQKNIDTLRKCGGASELLCRYDELAQLLTGNAKARAEEGADWTAQLSKHLGIKGLAELGLAKSDIPATARQARQSSSIQANPVSLDEEALEEILYQAS